MRISTVAAVVGIGTGVAVASLALSRPAPRKSPRPAGSLAATTLPPSLPPIAQAPGYSAAPTTGYALVPAGGLTLQAVPVKDSSQNPAGLIHPPAINHRASLAE